MGNGIHGRVGALSICVSALAWVPRPSQAAPEDPAATTDIYGGSIAKRCEFPTTLSTGNCTGVLIHPRVILTARHCGGVHKVGVGESLIAPTRQVETKWCAISPDPDLDAQICVLKTPIEGLPVAPIIQGCESEAIRENAEVILAGFGMDENDEVGTFPNEKRWVKTRINKVEDTQLLIGGNGKGGCEGDSGGPVYMQLIDGTWRTIGFTMGGSPHPDCDEGRYRRTDSMLDWYQKQIDAHGEKDIDLSPCYNEKKEWAPTKGCGGYAKNIRGPFGEWSNYCGAGVPVELYSASCGKAYVEQMDPKDRQGSDPTKGKSAEKPKPEPEPDPNKNPRSGTTGGTGERNGSQGNSTGPAQPDTTQVPGNSVPTDHENRRGGPRRPPPGRGCSLAANAEPSSKPDWLLLAGIVGLAWRRKRRKRHRCASHRLRHHGSEEAPLGTARTPTTFGCTLATENSPNN